MKIVGLPSSTMKPTECTPKPASINKFDHTLFQPVTLSSLSMPLKTRIPVLENLFSYGGAPTSSPDVSTRGHTCSPTLKEAPWKTPSMGCTSRNSTHETLCTCIEVHIVHTNFSFDSFHIDNTFL